MKRYLELVDGSFTQENFDKQKNQNPYVAYSIQDDKVIYNIVPNEDGTMYTIYKVVSKDISNCTYNMVDLGLSVKWADRNIGAMSPEDYGSYFQWGGTNAYTFDGVGEITAAELASLLQPIVGNEMEVTKDNVGEILEMMGITGTDLTFLEVRFSLDKSFDFDSYFDTTDGGSTFNKYNNQGGLTTLESVDDAATVYMGSQYRMPTSTEIRELIESTTQTFIDIDGNEYIKDTDTINIEFGKLKGVRFTGSNGNSIFIPTAGLVRGNMLVDFGVIGTLWSSSLFSLDDSSAWFLQLRHESYGSDVTVSSYDRCDGRSIRGVHA